MSQKRETKVPERTVTPRAAIRAALSGQPLSAHQISERAGVSEKEVATHLGHLERSLRQKGERLVIKPAECLACGFTFEDRRRLTTPGSCPSCQSERVAPPTFQVQGRAADRR